MSRWGRSTDDWDTPVCPSPRSATTRDASTHFPGHTRARTHVRASSKTFVTIFHFFSAIIRMLQHCVFFYVIKRNTSTRATRLFDRDRGARRPAGVEPRASPSSRQWPVFLPSSESCEMNSSPVVNSVVPYTMLFGAAAALPPPYPPETPLAPARSLCVSSCKPWYSR